MIGFLLLFVSSQAFMFEMEDTVYDHVLERYKAGDQISGSFYVVRGGAYTVSLNVYYFFLFR